MDIKFVHKYNLIIHLGFRGSLVTIDKPRKPYSVIPQIDPRASLQTISPLVCTCQPKPLLSPARPATAIAKLFAVEIAEIAVAAAASLISG